MRWRWGNYEHSVKVCVGVAIQRDKKLFLSEAKKCLNPFGYCEAKRSNRQRAKIFENKAYFRRSFLGWCVSTFWRFLWLCARGWISIYPFIPSSLWPCVKKKSSISRAPLVLVKLINRFVCVATRTARSPWLWRLYVCRWCRSSVHIWWAYNKLRAYILGLNTGYLRVRGTSEG